MYWAVTKIETVVLCISARTEEQFQALKSKFNPSNRVVYLLRSLQEGEHYLVDRHPDNQTEIIGVATYLYNENLYYDNNLNRYMPVIYDRTV